MRWVLFSLHNAFRKPPKCGLCHTETVAAAWITEILDQRGEASVNGFYHTLGGLGLRGPINWGPRDVPQVVIQRSDLDWETNGERSLGRLLIRGWH